MGALSLQDFANHADLETTIGWHLQCNCYPPIPATYDVKKAAIVAIKALRDGEPTYLVRWDEQTFRPADRHLHSNTNKGGKKVYWIEAHVLVDILHLSGIV